MAHFLETHADVQGQLPLWSPPPALVFDMDGVIRHWPSGIWPTAERAGNLAPGSLICALFEPRLLHRVTTGQITCDQWYDAIATTLAASQPESDPAAAIAVWSEPVGEIAPSAFAALDLARSGGIVALLSNATDRLAADMAALWSRHNRDPGKDFDHIFNSADIGHAKPDLAIYEHVESAMNITGASIHFFDDRQENLDAAALRGWHTHLITNDDDLLPAVRRALNRLAH